MRLNPVRKGLVKRPEDWRWSSYNNFALDKAMVAARLVQIDHVSLPEGYPCVTGKAHGTQTVPWLPAIDMAALQG